MKKAIFMLMILSVIFGQSKDETEFLSEINKRINSSHYNGNEKSFHILSGEIERFRSIYPKNWYGVYYQAYIYDHIATLNLKKNEDKADQYFDKSLELLDLALEEKKDVVLYSMYADILGKKIGISGIRGMTLGPKSQSIIEKAKAIDRNHPRLLLTEAISKMMTPGFFGGDKELSRRLLIKTLSILENYTYKDHLMLKISKADIYAWLSQLDILEEKNVSAKENAQKALAIEPEYGFVKYALLPGIKN